MCSKCSRCSSSKPQQHGVDLDDVALALLGQSRPAERFQFPQRRVNLLPVAQRSVLLRLALANFPRLLLSAISQQPAVQPSAAQQPAISAPTPVIPDPVASPQ